MLEDTWQTEGFFTGNVVYPMWESYPVFQTRPNKEDNIGLAEAITKSILSTGRFISHFILSYCYRAVKGNLLLLS